MERLYFVRKDNKYLWKDGKFYEGFLKPAYAIHENALETIAEVNGQNCEFEYADPDKWPELYNIIKEPVEKRRTYVRCATFALAAVLDQLYSDENTQEVHVSLEDSDFLVSFNFIRNYERESRQTNDACKSADE